jgi:pyrimidine-nucleoside phosphorylase
MNIKALITRMEEPLGWAIGNSLEVIESVEILKGMHGDSDLAKMSFRLAAEMLIMGGAAQSLAEAEKKVADVIASGKAMEAYRNWVTFNGGDATALDDFSRLPQHGQVFEIKAPRDGYIRSMDSQTLGLLAMELGAGRRSKNDVLDLGVGIRLHRNVGDAVKQGETLFTVYAKQGAQIPVERYLDVVEWQATPVTRSSWLLDCIEAPVKEAALA